MKESEIAQAYKKYLGPKCSRTQFYLNIKKGMDIIEAIKPMKRGYSRKIKTATFAEEMERYYKYEGEKVDKDIFYQRIYQGRSKEEAIKVVLQPKIKVSKSERKKKKEAYQKKIVQKIHKQEDLDIRITYSTEEADVFRREYERMINELQLKCDETDDIIEAREIKDKLERVKKEYFTFNLYNKNG